MPFVQGPGPLGVQLTGLQLMQVEVDVQAEVELGDCCELGIPAPVLTLALYARFASQDKGDYADKLLAMMRKGFGGHKVTRGAGGR